MIDRRPLYVLAAIVAVLIAAYAFTRSSDDTTPVATVVTEPTSPVVSITSTTAADATPEWRRAFDRIIAAQNGFLQDPASAKVGDIIDQSCSCYESTRSGLAEMAAKGHRVRGDTLKPTQVVLVSSEGGVYRIAVTLVGTKSPTIDSNGAVVSSGQSGNLQPVLYVIQKDSRGVWKVYDRRVYEER